MNILLTNDDGINAEGIRLLAATFSKKHNVFIVAPKFNKSGASSQMNVAVPLELKKVDKENCCLSYYLEGSPVDCVLSALKGEYISEKIDVIVSGINDGPNIGTDIVYSGTCGAARQACISGIPGIALSIDSASKDESDKSGSLYFENLADFACKNLDKLISLCGNLTILDSMHKYYRNFVNVNAPAMKSYKGAKLTVPCIRRYWETLEISECENGCMTSKCGGDACVHSYGNDFADFKACEKGFISVSVVETEPSYADISSIKCDFNL